MSSGCSTSAGASLRAAHPGSSGAPCVGVGGGDGGGGDSGASGGHVDRQARDAPPTGGEPRWACAGRLDGAQQQREPITQRRAAGWRDGGGGGGRGGGG
eukprot:scaffold24045_cov36-Phaeocystis_antarctica.AAC.1